MITFVVLYIFNMLIHMHSFIVFVFVIKQKKTKKLKKKYPFGLGQ